ncbi:MAG: circadian clock KaiB family protein [Microcoleaceae cyanobacterium MO_207.B10]|nr:circadian clock KaiB family protein [Microcoleaceae cyanobacterium MO_207.B10]
MKPDIPEFPQLFKGIALFTPGGDLVYCIDPSKQKRWHLHLCVELQEILGLSEPPHFLVPGYTATIDKWLDPRTQEIKISAEAYAPVLRYQALLNAIFNTGEMIWQPAPWSEEFCNPMVMATNYDQFPQLWESHDLVVRLDGQEFHPNSTPAQESFSSVSDNLLLDSVSTVDLPAAVEGYVLRLFISGNSVATQRTLENLHHILETSLSYPYTLKVIDVFKHPEQAEIDQITATPTLIRIWPLPVRRIVGEFDDMETILRLLQVSDSRF